MTATDAIWTQDGSFTAAEDRSLISALTGARHFTDLAPGISKVDAGGGHGVVGSTDLAVTPGSGHSVDVAAGQAFVRNTQSAGQGTYLVGNDATLNLAVSTPDATNDRIDLIQIRVSDDSAGAGVTTIDVKAGTPAGSPSAPTPDENALVLAEVLVPASAASSANYTVTDRRTRAAALGGIQPYASSATYPNPATEGMVVYDLALNQVLLYTGSTWRRVDWDAAWGHVGSTSGAGTAFAALTPDQLTLSSVPVVNGRRYKVTMRYRCRSDVADTAFRLSLQRDSGSGYSTIRTVPETIPIASVSNMTAHLDWTETFTASATANNSFKIVAERFAGTGTITPDHVALLVEDIGPS